MVVKGELLEVLNDWNFWGKEQATGVRRDKYLETLRRFIRTGMVVAVMGVRRSGKSYLMRQMAKDLIKNGTKEKNILMINFEDPRFGEPSLLLLDEIYETYLSFLKPDGTHFIFLDEVQHVDKWERWVRTFHELKKARIIVSGSSSKLLAGELATVLTGRHLDLFVFPLSFKEFLKFRNVEIKDVKDELELRSKRIEITALLREYFEFGGFPEVVLKEEKKNLLLTYFDDIVAKDLIKRFKIKKPAKISALAKFYLTNISSPITFASLEKFLGLSDDTIEKYSGYIEAVNLIFFLKRFSFSLKEQEKSPRKVYSADVGLSNAVGFRFSENFGKIAENLVAIELRRKQAENPLLEVYYWKDQYGKEVDFILKEGLKINQLVQVCWDITDVKTKMREVKALLKASEEVKNSNLLVITNDYEGEEEIKNKKIKFIPLWRWLVA